MTEPDPTAAWLRRWALQPDGEAFDTPFGSRLAPVRRENDPAMLKIAGGPEERDGAALMEWWGGDGAARVFAREGDALLMERALSGATLANLATRGDDDRATDILCAVASRLHEPRVAPPPATLRPLSVWFRALEPAAAAQGGILRRSAQAARSLLLTAGSPTVLHGDLHHDNILDFGPRGWLAIDPKGLVGERGFDFANLFCNPWPMASEPGRFDHRLAHAAKAAAIEPGRLRLWVLAYAGLSAAWTIESAMPTDGPWRALAIAELAASGL